MASALSFGDSIPFADFAGKIKGSFGKATDIGSTFSLAGGAVSDLFASKASGITAAGDRAAAGAARRAAGLATENLDFEYQSTALKSLQADRSIYQTISSAEANISGNGLKASGSALDILRDSATQGELTKHIIGVQGQMDANAIQQQIASFSAQADQYDSAAAAADSAGSGSLISGLIKGAGAVASAAMFFSDRALKTDIVLLGAKNNIPWYSYRWRNSNYREEGFLADEVAKVKPEAVKRHENGYLMVDYNLAVA